MKLIVTHEQPDFDALASVALARLAHPGAVAVVTGSLGDAVKAFMHLYRDLLDLSDPQRIDLDAVAELIVVDTNEPGRIAPFDALLGRVPVTVYDHHPREQGSIAAARGIQERVGATATLLTRHLQASRIAIAPEIASLALLAIHEDTGNLSYPLTRADDYEAAAYLLRCGANLDLVGRFTREGVSDEHRAFLGVALEHARSLDHCGYALVVSAFVYPRYLQGVSGLCNELLALHGADAALLVVRMDDKTLVFARAHRGFDVGAALADAFGGGGHPGAAFARSDEPPEEALARALTALTDRCQPPLSAAEIMSAPVKTVSEHATVAEAQRLLVQFGHNGLPVIGDDGTLCGVLSRRDLERALRHDLGRTEVAGFMSREVITATPQTTLRELENLIERHNIGRIPILEGEALVGIVTRTDLLRSRHERASENLAQRVLARLPSEALTTLDTAQAQLPRGATLYLVGGTVRDALLGRALEDLDLAVEGSGTDALGARLQRVLGGRLAYHTAFGTSTLTLPSGLTVDLATSREEVYEHPGALPEVTPSPIRKDLSRRDYTINALAVRLGAPLPALLDPYGGVKDLEHRVLRLLHPLSFIEDPTRILRGARLAGRLDFRFDDTTRERAERALTPGVIDRVSHARLRSELELTLGEPRVAPALAVMAALGALEAIYRLDADLDLLGRLDALRGRLTVPAESYLLALLLRTSDDAVEWHLQAFHWPRRLATLRARLADAERADTVDDDALAEAGEAERALLRALSDALAARVEAFETVPKRRRLRGRDVLDLGLSPGPRVGEVLATVARARTEGRVTSFDDELALARRLLAENPSEAAQE